MWLTIGMIVFLGACIAVPFVLVPRLRKASRPLPDIGPAEVHDQGVVAGRGYEHDPPAGYTGPPQLGWFSVWRAASPADRANVEYEWQANNAKSWSDDAAARAAVRSEEQAQADAEKVAP